MKNSNNVQDTTNVGNEVLADVRRCYYNDDWCKGKIIPVNSFHKYLCERCAKENDSISDDCGDIHDFSISKR